MEIVRCHKCPTGGYACAAWNRTLRGFGIHICGSRLPNPLTWIPDSHGPRSTLRGSRPPARVRASTSRPARASDTNLQPACNCNLTSKIKKQQASKCHPARKRKREPTSKSASASKRQGASVSRPARPSKSLLQLASKRERESTIKIQQHQ